MDKFKEFLQRKIYAIKEILSLAPQGSLLETEYIIQLDTYEYILLHFDRIVKGEYDSEE